MAMDSTYHYMVHHSHVLCSSRALRPFPAIGEAPLCKVFSPFSSRLVCFLGQAKKHIACQRGC